MRVSSEGRKAAVMEQRRGVLLNLVEVVRLMATGHEMAEVEHDTINIGIEPRHVVCVLRQSGVEQVHHVEQAADLGDTGHNGLVKVQCLGDSWEDLVRGKRREISNQGAEHTTNDMTNDTTRHCTFSSVAAWQPLMCQPWAGFSLTCKETRMCSS